MRINKEEIKAIKDAVSRLDRETRIYLFGSRIHDYKRGGDIDLLIISDKLTYDDRIEIKKILFDRIGEQKLDILIESDLSKPFVKRALEEGMLL